MIKELPYGFAFQYDEVVIPDEVLIVACLLAVLNVSIIAFISNRDNKSKLIKFLLLCEYYIVVLSATILFREPIKERQLKFDYFHGCIDLYKEHLISSEFFFNVLLFIPLGLLLYPLFRKYKIVCSLVLGFLLSLNIEWIQLVTHRGVFDVDDLINNTIGTAIGCFSAFFIYFVYNKLKVK